MCVAAASFIQAASGPIAARRPSFWRHNRSCLFSIAVAARMAQWKDGPTVANTEK